MAQSKAPAQPLGSPVRDPDQWTTGAEPMTGAQASYLHTLAEQADEPEAARDDLTKAEASKAIDALRKEVGLAKG